MVSFKSIFLFASTAVISTASAFKKRTTVATVINGVTVLYSNVKRLINATETYTRGFLPALTLVPALDAVYLSLFDGVVDFEAFASTVSESGAWALINHVNTVLIVDNLIDVKTLESKKSEIQAADLDGMIVAALVLFKAGHNSFGQHVLVRIPAGTVTSAMEVIEVIDAALQLGIGAFEGTN